MNNLHINLNAFTNASRVLKQVQTISTLREVKHVYIAALYVEDHDREEIISKNITLKRFNLLSGVLGKTLLLQLIKFVEYNIRILLFYRTAGIGVVNIHHWALLPLGSLLKSFFGAKLIYDTHELETETNGLYGVKKKIAKIVEFLFIKRADHIFVVSENIADWYCEKYDIQRPTVILNAPRLTSFEQNNAFRKYFNLRDNQKLILYQGLLAPGRGIELLVEAFSKRINDAAVIIFLGYGPLEKEIHAASCHSDNIFLHEAVPPDDLLKYTSSADIGVALIPKVSLSDYYCMPNKLFEYCMAGLPVLASNLKEMKEFIDKYQIGFVSNDLSTGAINKIIDVMAVSDLTKFKNNARVAASENSWEIQETKMLDVYNDLIGINN